MACTESFCWSVSITPPEFPPPPPLPSFVFEALKLENVSDTCNLCSTWGDLSPNSAGHSTGDNFTLVLSIVAVISALSGAGIMAGTILSVKRMRRNRKFENSTGSVRHLERKCGNEQSLPITPSRSSNSTPMTNTYCEGPYNDNKEYQSSNIYAELHTGASDVWRRPPIPTPVDNCYLELRDIPGPCEMSQCLNSSTYSPSTTTSYYTDLELKNSELN